MQRAFPSPLLVALAGLLVVPPSGASRLSGQEADGGEKVNGAIDRGISYLMGEVEKEQLFQWKDDPARRGPGQVALETYALVVAGVDVEHPLIKRNFEWLATNALNTGYTYTLACYAFALDAAIAQKEADLMLANPEASAQKFKDNPAIGREYRGPLETTIQRLAALQKPFGAWHYDSGGNYDNSNTQFAVLALGVGAKRNIPIDPIVWERIVDHFIRDQDQKKEGEVKDRLTMMTESEVAERQIRGRKPKEKVDVEVIAKDGAGEKGKAEKGRKGKDKGEKEGKTGVAVSRTKVGAKVEVPEVGTEHVPVYSRGWKYDKGRDDKTWNMTCAGLSSILLARDSLKGRLAPDKLETLNAAVRDGFGWVMTHWNSSPSSYGKYSLEKVADIGGVKKFGPHDWYEEMSNAIVSSQQGDGSWTGDDHGNNRVATAFHLLVLNRASSLITMTLMSQNPMARIMVSGRRSNLNDPSDRSWVYVPDLDTTLHFPTLVRMIKRRAHPKLIQYLQSIVKNYEEMWKGELIPEMARVRDEVRDKDGRKHIEGYLSEITGYKYEKWEDYLKWHRRWEKVMLIGTQQKADRIPDLLKYYENTKKSFVLKSTVIWALQQTKAKEAIPLFLKDLSSNDPRVRDAAYKAFRSFYVDYPPRFDPAASQSARAQQIAAIEEWHREQEKKAVEAAKAGG
jgi:hypothetical protein